jgi:hypothetical protein
MPDNSGFQPEDGAQYAVSRQIETAALGKTISEVWMGPDHSVDERGEEHRGERLVLQFTDGTQLELTVAHDLSFIVNEYS